MLEKIFILCRKAASYTVLGINLALCEKITALNNILKNIGLTLKAIVKYYKSYITFKNLC